MVIISPEEVRKLDIACKKLLQEKEIGHVGVINSLGRLIAGGFSNNVKPLLDEDTSNYIFN